MYTLIVIAIVVVMLATVGVAARKFAERQRRNGRWTEHGPVRPTRGPLDAGVRGSMSERLEVIGAWIPRPEHEDDGARAPRKRRAERRRRPGHE